MLNRLTLILQVFNDDHLAPSTIGQQINLSIDNDNYINHEEIFYVIEAESRYNSTKDITWQSTFGTILYTPYHMMKFHAPGGHSITELYINQVKAIKGWFKITKSSRVVHLNKYYLELKYTTPKTIVEPVPEPVVPK